MLRLALPLLAFLVLACGEVRQPSSPRQTGQYTYTSQIKPLLEQRCVWCHGGQQPAGNYDLSSYLSLLRPGSGDRPEVIAGDSQSPLLIKLDSRVDPVHWGYLLPPSGELASDQSAEQRRQAARDMLRHWVVEDHAAYFDIAEHPPGWLYAWARGSDSFHGGYLRNRDWKHEGCSVCHRADHPAGDGFGPPCESCHRQGALGCTTCHGDDRRAASSAVAPPFDLSWSSSRVWRGVGTHQPHLQGSSIWSGTSCQSCHRVPSTLRETSHLGNPDFRAEVVFSGIAAQGATEGYDRDNLTCAGVYCHGGPLNDPAAQRIVPRWTDTSNLQCTSCHGMPPARVRGGSSHPTTDAACKVCHASAYAGYQLDPTKHVNGVVDM